MTLQNKSKSISIQPTVRDIKLLKTPLAPPGFKVIVHECPQERETWADHGIMRLYIGPEMHNFRNSYF